MLTKFKSLEKQASTEAPLPAGPKPLKRITPPRELTNGSGLSLLVKDESPERDPSIGTVSLLGNLSNF